MTVSRLTPSLESSLGSDEATSLESQDLGSASRWLCTSEHVARSAQVQVNVHSSSWGRRQGCVQSAQHSTWRDGG